MGTALSLLMGMADEVHGLEWLLKELPRAFQRIEDRQEREAQARRTFEVEVRERLDRIELRLPPAVLTRKQAAKLLKTSVRAVDYALDNGALREVRVVGVRSRLVDATSIKSMNVSEELQRLKEEIYTG